MLKSIIHKTNSWNDLKSLLDTKTKQEKGQAFEELSKYFLEYNPVYKTKLKQVWLHKEIPPSVSKKLNLPSNDQGIDLIAETFEGTYWAIQCKYLQDEDQRLSHRAISTFISLSTGIAKDITYCLVCTTVDEYAKIYQGKENIGFVNSDEWRKLDKVFFDWLRNKLSGKEKKLIPYKPKPHQVKALKEAKNYFLKANNARGKLVFPCGAGKSLTGYWITRELKPKSIIVAVPSLSLVKQTLEVYLRESVANNDKVSWLCVCSDEGIGTNDDIAIHTNEIGVPCVTDKNYIAKWIKDNSKNKTIIFTTYQSGKTIAEACKIAKHEFDLGIMDEAHKTVGDKDKLFSHLLFDKNLKIKKRIFMTATERRYAGSSDLVLSMDDVNVYGDTFTQMSFKEAIEIGILSDYRIITLFISNDEVKSLIKKNAFVKPTGKEWDKETEARTLASLIALRKAMTEYPIHHAVTFHSSIKKAEAFEQSQSVFSTAYPQFAKVESFHVSGAMPTSKRGKIVDEFAQTEKGIITNAKCLTEGVDVPNIDCVLFADPRKSTVDIVQAVGRALRRKDGKDFGYVILPVFTESNNTDEIINSDEFKEILSTIRALASNDERIIEYFKDVSKGVKKSKKDSLVQFDVDVQLSERINEKELIDSIQLKTWDKLAKLSWMPFDLARDFVRQLKLDSGEEWKAYSKTSKKPFDIPSDPRKVYGEEWISMGDWLGTYRIADQLKEYRSFEEARAFVHSLKLKNRADWSDYCKNPKYPIDIPKNPNQTYKDKGWKGFGDWIGTYTIAPSLRNYREFNLAREYVHTLKLKNRKEWNNYCDSGKMPLDIPMTPSLVYKHSGWKSMGDWLGTEFVATYLREYLPFQEAREYIHSLKFKNTDDWLEFCNTNKKPTNIPAKPRDVYYNSGWKNMGDWLGTYTIANINKEFKSFNEAREFVHSLKLKNQKEWRLYCKSGKKPNYIPSDPHHVYKNAGWVSYGDWIGTGRIADIYRVYLPFKEAREFARALKFKNQAEWIAYCKSGKKPDNIPYSPSDAYKGKGFAGIADFLGYGNAKPDQLLSFHEAKKYLKKYGFKNQKEFIEAKKGNKITNRIPVLADRKYKDQGWAGWGDFLGSGNVGKYNDLMPFEEAREYAQKLGFKTADEWKDFMRSKKKPANIPVSPMVPYKDKWKGWGDFLGTGRIADMHKVYLPFKEAREFARNLRLKSITEWKSLHKSKNKPNSIPVNADRRYKDEGWLGWKDFLGNN